MTAPENGNSLVAGQGVEGITLENTQPDISTTLASISNAEFLSAIFGQYGICWTTKFRENPATATAGCWNGQFCRPENASDDPNSNAYFSVASFKPDAKRRTYENFVGLVVVVLDDPENVPLAPSWRLQTSPDKYQAGYRLTEAVIDIEIAKRLHKQLGEAGHLPVDRNGNNPVRYVRLPVGVNTKHDPPFPCTLETFDPELIYSLTELIGGLGLDADYILHGKQSQQAAPTTGLGDIIPEGARNSTLTSLGGSMRQYGFNRGAIEAALLAENAERCRPMLPEAEVQGIAKSVARYPPSRQAVQGRGASSSIDIHFDVKPLTLDVLHTVYPPREFAIEPLLPRGVLIEFSGAHGISKSTLALDMTLCIGSDRPFCDLPTAHGKVVFASREDSYDEIVRRAQGWLEGISLAERVAAEQAICRNLILLGRQETEELRVTTKEFGKCSVRREAIDRIVERCQGAVLVVLETASRLHGGDELNEDLAQLAEAFEQIASRTGAAVLLVRHVSKESARSKSVDSYSGRGGGALSDAARSVLVLVQLTPEEALARKIALDGLAKTLHSPVIVLHHAKASYSQQHDPLYFIRLPGPRLQSMKPPNALDTFGERLLQFLKKESLLGTKPMSTREIKRRSKEFRVSQNDVEEVLEHLKKAGRIAKMETTQRGGTYHVWVPIQ